MLICVLHEPIESFISSLVLLKQNYVIYKSYMDYLVVSKSNISSTCDYYYYCKTIYIFFMALNLYSNICPIGI